MKKKFERLTQWLRQNWNGRKVAFVTVFALLLLLVIIPSMRCGRTAKNADSNDTEQVMSEPKFYNECTIHYSDTALMHAYIDAYPDGKHIDEVRNRYLTLVRAAEAWGRINQNNKLALQQYINEYPSTLDYDLAVQLHEQLWWDDVQNAKAPTDVMRACEEYMANCPTGIRYEAAAKMLKAKRDMLLTDQEKAQIASTLRTFFNALSRGSETQIATAAHWTISLNGKQVDKTQLANYLFSVYGDVYDISCTPSEIQGTKVLDEDTGSVKEYTVTFGLDIRIRENWYSTSRIVPKHGEVKLNGFYKITELKLK